MNVLYYYCYLIYTKLIPEDEPYATTIFVLSFLESFLIFSLASLLVAYFECMILSKWFGLSTMGLILLLNYFIYNRSGLSRKLVKEKPMFFKSHALSIVLVALFFILGISSLFLGPIYSKQILSQCK